MKKNKAKAAQVSAPPPSPSPALGQTNNINAASQTWWHKLSHIHTKIMVGLILILFVAFNKMPVTQVTDAQFSLLLSHAIAHDQTTRIDTYLDKAQYTPNRGFFYWFWQLSPARGGTVSATHNGDWWGEEPLYYRYPNLPSVLAIPLVLAIEQMGLSPVDERGFYNHRAEHQIHRLIAALLAAMTVALFFRMATLALPTSWALILALVLGLGTQLVSTLSRGVWTDTWAVPISILALHHLLAHALGKAPFRPIFVAVLCALAFFCKPNYAVVGIGALIYGFSTVDRRHLRGFMVLGCVLALGFMGISLWQFGTIIPDYYRPAIEVQYIPNALIGHLFSPSRGILVYSPFIMMVLYLLWINRTLLCAQPLVRACWLPIALLMFVSSAWGTWWGGHSYGPRLITPLLPWIVLLSIIALESFGRSLANAKAHHATPSFERYQQTPMNYPFAFSWIGLKNKMFILTLLVVTAIWSLFIHIHGATETRTWLEWFYQPYPVFNAPETRIWDWRDAQWLTGIIPRPHESLRAP